MDSDELARLQDALDGAAHQVITRADGSDVEQLLERLTASAVAHIPGVDHAGMTMQYRGPGKRVMLISQAPSDSLIASLDARQVELGEGPCLDALAPGSSATVRVDDFTDETDRWPRFAPEAVEAGIGSLLSHAIAPHDAIPGAINFYATATHAFDTPTCAIAGAFVGQVAMAVYGATKVANLTRALHTRDLIGCAKGILMERFALDDQQAFDLLVQSSQDTNVKLTEVARWLTGETSTDTAVERHTTGHPEPARPPRLGTDPV